MTGYGAARAAGTRVAVEAQVRSVNARSLKTMVRSPQILAPREAELEGFVRRHVRRGSVTLFLRLDFLKPQDLLRIRPEVVEGFARALEPLRKKGLVEGKLTPDALAVVPGALEAGAEDPLRPADWKAIREAVEGALEDLGRMRQREAVHLVKGMRAITRRMKATLTRIRRRAPKVVREHEDRLRERIDALLADRGAAIDDATLAREVALFADRSDITEEIVRLAAHLEEFDQYLDQDAEIGRTLDFLSQELLRETNTIGSKSSDVEIARDVISLKSDIDRLKEQAANLE